MSRRTWLLVLLALVLLCALVAPRAFAVHPSEIAPSSNSVSFQDRSGIPLGTILSSSQERAVAVPLSRISPLFVQAVIAAEDRRYYKHGAIDWLALARVAWRDAGCLCDTGGASTIEMQVARMQFDVPGGARGKLRQMWDAMRIEAGSGKADILSAYVNRAAMGGNVYGVEAAARTYFGIPASDLDAAQAALLAGIPNDPVGLNPRTHWQAARARQRVVLAAMVAAGDITPNQAAGRAPGEHPRTDSRAGSCRRAAIAFRARARRYADGRARSYHDRSSASAIRTGTGARCGRRAGRS